MWMVAQAEPWGEPVMNKTVALSKFQISVACLITCVAVASVYWTQTVLLEVGVAFSVTAAQARLAFGACSIAYAIAFFLVAPLADRISARSLAQFGLAATAIAASISASLNSFHAYIAIVILHGGFAAAVPAAMFALMSRVARKERLGSYFGFLIAASVAGITIGRVAMGWLATLFGFREGLLIGAVALLIAMGLAQALPKEDMTRKTRFMDFPIMYLKTVRILVNPVSSWLYLIGFLLFSGYLGVITFLTLRLQQAPFLLDGSAIGAVSLAGLSAVLGAPISGGITSRIGSFQIALAGLACVFVGVVCIFVAQSIAAVVVGVFLIFLGVFACQPAMLVRLSERVGSENRGAASSLYMLTCLGAGGGASVALGPVWSNYGWRGVSIVCGVAIVLGMAALKWDAYLFTTRRHVRDS